MNINVSDSITPGEYITFTFRISLKDHLLVSDSALSVHPVTIAVYWIKPIWGGTGGAGETYQASAQRFPVMTQKILGVTLKFYKSGTPTDNLLIEICQTFVDNPSLGSITVDSTSITSGTRIKYLFNTPIELATNSSCYLRISRSGVRSTSNYVGIYSTRYGDLDGKINGLTYESGVYRDVWWVRDNNSWSEFVDYTMSIFDFDIHFGDMQKMQMVSSLPSISDQSTPSDTVSGIQKTGYATMSKTETISIGENVSVFTTNYFKNISDTSSAGERIYFYLPPRTVIQKQGSSPSGSINLIS